MLDRTTFFIREHVGMFKLTDTYDILDPETEEQIGLAKEEPGGFVKFLRFLVNKRMLPTQIDVYEGPEVDDDYLLFSITRGFTFFRSKIRVIDADGEEIGWFRQKMFTWGASFTVLDAEDREVAEVKGDWKGWNFKFLMGDEEIGIVTKEWAGIAKALFTSADNYVVELFGRPSETKSMLLLAAGLAIDMVFHEQ